MTNSLYESIDSLRTIKLERDGTAFQWKFNKLTIDDSGVWVLILDLMDPIESFKMVYDVSLVLDPSNYNKSIRGLIKEFESDQTNLLSSEVELLNKINNCHSLYENDSGSYGIYDFQAVVVKFERKTDSKQVKVIVESKVAEYFCANFNELYRSVLILNLNK